MSFIQCQSTSLDNPSTTSQAARCGNLKALNELIDKGHPVDVMDNRGWMSLQEAAYENHVECLKLLLKQADTSVNHVSFDGRSALLLATEQGHYESMELLLAHNADPNLGDAMQTYPILEAVISTKLECVNLLLDAGAAVDKQNYCGTSALNHACSEGMCDIAKALLQAGASLTSLEDYNITPIFNAARYNQPECLTLLIEEAKERDELHALDMQASDGGTAVYIAAQEGHLECLQLLLKHGASANIPTNSQSALPLYAALKFAREGCVDLLLKVTDQSLFIRCHSSPIEHALYAENISILQKMMDSGIDPNFSHFSEYYCDYHSYSASPCLELSMLEFNKAIHPLALVFLLINNEVEEFLHLLYKAGSHCADLPPRGLSPLLTASHRCNLADYKSLVTRGKAKVDVYHKHALGNVVLLHAMVSYAKLFWLLQSGADCDSLFIPTHSRVGNYKATFLTTLNEIFNLHPAVDFVKSVLYIIVQSTSQRVKSLDSVDGVKEIVGEEMWNTANDIIESPRSLFHQTRICIRRSLGVEALIHREMLSTLKLPTALVDALLLRDLIHLTVGDPEKYLDEGF